MLPEALSAVQLPTQSAAIMRRSVASRQTVWREICRDARIDIGDIDRPTARILASEEWRLQLSVAAATHGNPRTWFEMGQRYCITSYGPYGIALLSAETVGEALRIATSFQELTYSQLTYRPLLGEGGKVRGVLADEHNVPSAVREFCLMRDLGALRRLHDDLVSEKIEFEAVTLSIPRPDGWDDFGRDFGCEVQFDAPRTMWCLAKGAEDIPLPLADPVMLDAYVQFCSEELQSTRRHNGIELALTEFLLGEKLTVPALEDAARHLGLSKRSLNRRLAECGTSFSAVLDQVRRQRAEQLLLNSPYSVEVVGEMIGYSETANFSRAFKRWTGVSPLHFRNGHRTA